MFYKHSIIISMTRQFELLEHLLRSNQSPGNFHRINFCLMGRRQYSCNICMKYLKLQKCSMFRMCYLLQRNAATPAS
jgi:hypothetical protein